MKMLGVLKNIISAQFALACLMSPALLAADNLVSNPNFQTPTAPDTDGTPGWVGLFGGPAITVPPGLAVAYSDANACRGGASAAAGWTIFVNDCPGGLGTFLFTELAPVSSVSPTLPVPGYNGNLMHVLTNVGGSGIVNNNWLNTAPNAVSSAWVYINAGCVGISTGYGGAANDFGDEVKCTKGSWLPMSASSTTSPATEFIVYSEACQTSPNCLNQPPIYDFYVAKVDIEPFPTSDQCAACNLAMQTAQQEVTNLVLGRPSLTAAEWAQLVAKLDKCVVAGCLNRASVSDVLRAL